MKPPLQVTEEVIPWFHGPSWTSKDAAADRPGHGSPHAPVETRGEVKGDGRRETKGVFKEQQVVALVSVSV